MAQQLHERAHFVLGPAPVVAGERKQRELGDAEIRRRFDDAPCRGDARPVPGRSWQTATHRPAAIAVHDNGHVKALFALQSTLHCKVSTQKKLSGLQLCSPDCAMRLASCPSKITSRASRNPGPRCCPRIYACASRKLQ